MNKKYKIGVIGCGTVAGYGHLPVLSSHPDWELYAIAELRKDRLNEIGDKYAIPSSRRFTNYHDLVALKEIDAVTVSTRVEQHFPVVIAAAKAGKHIFCEKPLASSVEEGWEMIRASKIYGVWLILDFHTRVKSSILQMQEYIRSGRIGNLHTLRMIHLWYGPSPLPEDIPGYSRRDFLMEEGGGPIFDCGVHFFDTARFITGFEFQNISAKGQWGESKYSNPGHVIVSGILGKEILGIIEQSWLYTNSTKIKNVVHSIEAIGTEGLIIAFWDWDISLQQYHGEKVRLFFPEGLIETSHPVDKPFHEIYHQFAQVIQTGNNPTLADGLDGITAMETALKALDQCHSNRLNINPLHSS